MSSSKQSNKVAQFFNLMLLSTCLSISASAASISPRACYLYDASGNPLSSTAGSLNTSGGGGGGGNAAASATGATVPSFADFVGFSSGGNLVGVSASNPLPVSMSSTTVSNFPAIQAVSAVSLPLPTGASTAAGLTTINATLGSPFQTGGSIGNTSFGISGSLPGYASTPTFKSLINSNASGSAAAATVSTVQTLTAPANAVGFILMNLDVSTTNMRWAAGRTATSTLGQQLQPGRDTGFIPMGTNVSIVAEGGTVTYDIQWVSQ